MKKIIFRLFLIISTVASAAAVLLVVFMIGEKYFFDKLLFKKSKMHGYYPYHGFDYEFFETDKSFFGDPRHKDIANLFIDNKNQILGATTDEINEYKIAILGDSMSYGVGVRSNQSYPVLLEDYLNDLGIKNTNFTVLNYSMSGDDILDHYVKYLEAKKTDEVDLYILSIFSNDFFINSDDKYPGKNDAYLHLVDECKGTPLIEPLLNDGEESYDEKLFNQALFNASQSNINNCFFDFILNHMGDDEIASFTIGTGGNNQEDMSLENAWDIANAVYSKYLLRNKIEIWRFPFDDLEVDSDKLAVSDLESHPSLTAHKAYAYYLALNIVDGRLEADRVSDESREVSSKKLEQLFLQEVSKLK